MNWLITFLISWRYLLVSDILVLVGISFILSSCTLVEDIARLSGKDHTRKQVSSKTEKCPRKKIVIWHIPHKLIVFPDAWVHPKCPASFETSSQTQTLAYSQHHSNLKWDRRQMICWVKVGFDYGACRLSLAGFFNTTGGRTCMMAAYRVSFQQWVLSTYVFLAPSNGKGMRIQCIQYFTLLWTGIEVNHITVLFLRGRSCKGSWVCKPALCPKIASAVVGTYREIQCIWPITYKWLRFIFEQNSHENPCSL